MNYDYLIFACDDVIGYLSTLEEYSKETNLSSLELANVAVLNKAIISCLEYQLSAYPSLTKPVKKVMDELNEMIKENNYAQWQKTYEEENQELSEKHYDSLKKLNENKPKRKL